MDNYNPNEMMDKAINIGIYLMIAFLIWVFIKALCAAYIQDTISTLIAIVGEIIYILYLLYKLFGGGDR